MKDFIPYEIALELKKIGFNQPCYKYIFTWGEDDNAHDEHEFLPSQCESFNDNSFSVSQPTYSQSFRWFREKHNLKSCIMFRTSMADNEEYYDWLIKGQEVVYRHFKTYEEAELACIKELIKIVKTHEGGNK
jgi:dolichyl-phosphate-mannose--protein O-mannosyl transferase